MWNEQRLRGFVPVQVNSAESPGETNALTSAMSRSSSATRSSCRWCASSRPVICAWARGIGRLGELTYQASLTKHPKIATH